MREGDHYEVYRGVPIWIAAEYVERCRRYKFDAVANARDTVDSYFIYIEERKSREP